MGNLWAISKLRAMGKLWPITVVWPIVVSQAPKMWIGFDQNVFEFINVPVSSIHIHFDSYSFLLLKVLKPIANLNFLFLLFSELIKTVLKCNRNY